MSKIKYKTITLDGLEKKLSETDSKIEKRKIQELIEKEKEAIKDLEKKAQTPLKAEADINRVEIIILKYKSPEIEKDCINKIIEHTEHPYELTFYDNRPNLCNTAKAWNKLIKESSCPYIVIMDSDAFVEEKWLTKLMETFQEHKDAAVAVPLSGENSNVTTFQASSNRQDKITAVEGHFSGYCYLFSKEAFYNIGEFNEDFYVFGQESDWVNKLHHQGKYKVYCCHNVIVQHGYDKERGGSLSTSKAAKEGEFDWRIDAEYARWLVNYLQHQRKTD